MKLFLPLVAIVFALSIASCNPFSKKPKVVRGPDGSQEVVVPSGDKNDVTVQIDDGEVVISHDVVTTIKFKRTTNQ